MTVETNRTQAKKDRRALSDVFAGLAAPSVGRVTIGDILGLLSDRGFGAALILFAAPNCLPMPPGVASIFGIPLIFIAAQLMLGFKALWLPKRVAGWTLPGESQKKLAGSLASLTKRAEGFVRPRLGFLTSPISERILGGFALLLALVMLIPIPLGHLLPAISIVVLGLGLMEADGVFAALGVFCGLGSLGVIAAISGGLIALLARL